MRIFWMKSDFIVPADTGGKIRTYNLMRELRQLCDVTYLAYQPTDSPRDRAAASACATEIATIHRPEEIKSGWQFYARVLCGLPSPLPYIARKYRSAAMRQLLVNSVARSRGQGEECIVLCDFLEMAENVAWDLPCPKVLFQHNVESVIWERYFQTESHPLKKAYFGFESRRLKRYESRICNRFDLVFTVSGKDAARLRDGLQVRRPLAILETGVDTEFFRPRPATPTIPGRLLFLGSMDWMPNIDGVQWFVEEVWPLIRSERPEASLDIVGRRPGVEVRRLVQTAPGLRVVPDVPDVRPYLAEADLFVVPLRIGGGTRIKIYEAMAMAKPVVATSIGAEGLPLDPARHIALGDSAADFARCVVDLLACPSSKRRMAEAAHRFVVDNYQWNKVARNLLAHCEALTRGRSAGTALRNSARRAASAGG